MACEKRSGIEGALARVIHDENFSVFGPRGEHFAEKLLGEKHRAWDMHRFKFFAGANVEDGERGEGFAGGGWREHQRLVLRMGCANRFKHLLGRKLPIARTHRLESLLFRKSAARAAANVEFLKERAPRPRILSQELAHGYLAGLRHKTNMTSPCPDFNSAPSGGASHASRERWWRAALGLAAAWGAVALALAPKPWDVDFTATSRMGRLRDYVTFWGWWAGLLNVTTLTVLAAFSRWWACRLAARSFSFARFPCLAAGAAAALLLAFALPRLTHSLWVDEDFSVRDAVWGVHRPGPDGEPAFRKRSWLETLYFYETPNNHILFSVLGRLGLEIWQAMARPSGLPFAEWPFRLPSLLGGLVGLFAAAWLFALLRQPGAGALAALTLAVSPWYVRFSSEGRGYALLMALVLVLGCCMVGAVRDGRWRWWAAAGVAHFAILAVYPVALYVLVFWNLGCLAAIAGDAHAARPRKVLAARWFLSTALAAMATLQLLLPLQPQISAYLQKDIAQGAMGWHWIRDVAAKMFAGLPWTQDILPGYPHFAAYMQERPAGFALAVALAALGFFAGTARLWRLKAVGIALWTFFILPAPVCFMVATVLEQYLFDRYLMFLLPGAVAVVAAGWGSFGRAAGQRWGWLGLAAWAAYAAFTTPVLFLQIERTTNPIRESVLLTRPSLDPRDPRQKDIHTVSFSFTPLTYDARVRYVRTREELLKEMQEAKQTGRQFWVNIGNPWSASVYQKELWQMIHDPALFERPVRLRGWDATLDRIVVRARSDTLSLSKGAAKPSSF